MLDFISIPVVVGIITLGIYSLFELFVRKKERLTLIEKLGDKISPDLLKGKLNLPDLGRKSFGALKAAALFVGLGVGLMVGFIIERNVGLDKWNDRSIVYGASVLIGGGLALLIAFLIEYRLSRKNEE